MQQLRSITETPNELTTNIDLSTPVQIVRLLRAADAQIFSGYGGYPGLYDPETLNTLAHLAVLAARTLAKPTGRVVLSGAGTSGRLAMFTARAFNRNTTRQPFHYTIAGGNAALFTAQEGAEDDPHQGIKDLEAAAAGAEEVFYVGITCGLSAPYIAGQLEHMLRGKIKGHAVLLGFNPTELARNTPIEGWPDSFHVTAQRVAKAENATVLNPIVGPEPITGSTRMKSGSATKILLEVLFYLAAGVDVTAEDDEPEVLHTYLSRMARMLIFEYEQATRQAYVQIDALTGLVETGGETLRAGGHIYYIGATGPEEVETCHDDGCHDDHVHPSLSTEAGILGLVDASECPPTYGADFEDVRGFLHNGWEGLMPGTGVNLSSEGQNFQIGVEDFRSLKLKQLQPDDLVVFLGSFPERDELVEDVKKAGAKTAAIGLEQTGDLPQVDHAIRLELHLTTIEEEEGVQILEGPVQLAYKLVLNALTTGAHILKGKVYGNRMVDLRISNNKLFHRTVGIISDLMGVPQEVATSALVRSTYETDNLSSEQETASIRDHIEAAKAVDKVVPKALLLATGKYTYQQAAEALRVNPVVRAAIGTYVKS